MAAYPILTADNPMQSGPIPGRLGSMPMRITATDDAPLRTRPVACQSVRQPAAPFHPGPAFVDWNDPDTSALLLYLADEPEIGHRFAYAGVTWEVIDYHDGWVARMVV